MEEDHGPQKWHFAAEETIVGIIKEVAREMVERGETQLYKRDVAEAIRKQKIVLDHRDLQRILDNTLVEHTSLNPEDVRVKKVKVYDPSRLKENEEPHSDERLTGMFDELSSRRFRKTED